MIDITDTDSSEENKDVKSVVSQPSSRDMENLSGEATKWLIYIIQASKAGTLSQGKKSTFGLGGKYKGEMDSSGSASGIGVIMWPSGATLRGSFKEDKPHGYVVITDVWGRFEGEYKKGQAEGKSTWYDNDGLVWNKVWKKDRITSRIQVMKPTDAWFGDGERLA